MDNQEFFDTIVTKLIEQGQPSRSITDRCRYRGAENTKCAIGIIIPDEEYNANPIENVGVMTILESSKPWPTLIKLARMVDTGLMLSLQSDHDCTNPGPTWVDDFIRAARRTAGIFKLQTDCLTKVDGQPKENKHG